MLEMLACGQELLFTCLAFRNTIHWHDEYLDIMRLVVHTEQFLLIIASFTIAFATMKPPRPSVPCWDSHRILRLKLPLARTTSYRNFQGQRSREPIPYDYDYFL